MSTKFLEKFKKDWKSLRSIVWIESERTVNGKTTREVHHYISSLAPDPKELGFHIRSHWGIENKVHWILDVAFREDEQKARAGHIPVFGILKSRQVSILRCAKQLSYIKRSSRVTWLSTIAME